MRKLLVFCLLALMGLGSSVFAEDLLVRPTGPALEKQLVWSNERTGSCEVSEVDPAATVGSFGWDFSDAYAVYLDPAVNGDAGCSAPFYPFQVTSVNIPIVIFSSSVVGESVTFRVGIHCPADAATGNVTEACKGPGAEICGTTFTYLLTQEDFDAAELPLLSIPLECCVNGPFFLVASFISYTGDQSIGLAPSVGFDLTVGGPFTTRCDAFYFFDLGLGYCWYAGSLDFGCGATCNPGDIVMSVNGNAGVTACEPITCAPCVRTYPGDDASDPIEVSHYHWEQMINLCDYCSDYDMTFDAPAASYTGAGPDVVLEFTAADLGADQFCFNITLTPACEVPGIPFRLRSWLSTSLFGTIYFGTPNFPTFGQQQTYNFSGNGDVDDLGCFFPDTYQLFIDTRNCCCPVRVRFNGDNVLPVEISSFDAIAGDGQVTVGWRTNSESAIERYDIERNGEIIAEVASLGDSPSGHEYTYVDRSVVNDVVYTYRLIAYGVDGTATIYGQSVSATPTAGNGLVTEYSLMQNYPNPFNPTTTISYTVREMGDVSLKVYAVDGREVATLVDATQDAGSYSIDFDASGLASGMYLYKMTVNGYTASQKMVLMK